MTTTYLIPKPLVLRRRLCLLGLSASMVGPFVAHAQKGEDAPIPGPDSREIGHGPHGHLLGDWGGERNRLLKHGVRFDFQYVGDHLANVAGDKTERLVSWNRVRGTVDVDLGTLIGARDWFFHATGLWQAGGNLGTYMGLLTSPSGISSHSTLRLDSWWIEKRWLDDHVVARIGQFAGQDFYGAQHYAASFIFEPMGYALGNLFTTRESFDPPSTPAAEIRVMPLDYCYVKSMVFAQDPKPFAHNPTGFAPQFRGDPVSVSEIGFTPGILATSVRAFDEVEGRAGYTGLYRFGASYNPDRFGARSGNYLLYLMASQALWRVDPHRARGLDATVSYDWSPADANRNNVELTAGLRFNEPLPWDRHNTMSLGYVQNRLSADFVPPGHAGWKPEHGVELNALLDVAPMFFVQPVAQYFVNVGGGTGHGVVVGLRTKVEL